MRQFVEKLAKAIEERGINTGNGTAIDNLVIYYYGKGYFLILDNTIKCTTEFHLYEDEVDRLQKASSVATTRSENYFISKFV